MRQVLSGWLGIVLGASMSCLALVAGCRGLAPEKATRHPDRIAELAARGAVDGPEVPRSECADRDTCERECTAGGVNACSRLGDLVYTRSPESAETLWLDACEHRDGLGCYRLMSLAAHDSDLGDRMGLVACEYGERDACELAVKSMAVRALAPTKSESADRLREDVTAVAPAQCMAGYWASCALALELARDPSADAVKALARRALETAPHNCRYGEVSACYYVGSMHERLNAIEPARVFHARACGLLLHDTADTSKRVLERTHPCRRARDIGATITDTKPDLRPGYGDPEDNESWKRTSGETKLAPGMDIKEALIKLDKGAVALVASMRVCVTTSGLVSDVGVDLSSGYPSYDRMLFDNVRRWRYAPLIVDGVPKPFCTRVEIIYRQW